MSAKCMRASGSGAVPSAIPCYVVPVVLKPGGNTTIDLRLIHLFFFKTALDFRSLMAAQGSAQSFLWKARSNVWEQFTRKKVSTRRNWFGKEYKYCSCASTLQKHLLISHTDAWREVKSAKTTTCTKSIRSFVVMKGNSHYRKRGSASYIVREWLSWVVERETPVTSIDITLKSRVIMHMITSTSRRPYTLGYSLHVGAFWACRVVECMCM